MDIKKAEKALSIKANILKRTLKDYEYYLKEIASSEKYIENLKSREDSDPYDIKKATEVLQENQAMSQNALDRIDSSKLNLTEQLKEFELTYQSECGDSESSASQLINQVKEYLEKADNLKK
uniref:Tubulin-specific chaperone A n=1 Tax=Strongyloides papillosus TaxID=174720 RepID=A0A0N5BWV3_STREA